MINNNYLFLLTFRIPCYKNCRIMTITGKIQKVTQGLIILLFFTLPASPLPGAEISLLDKKDSYPVEFSIYTDTKGNKKYQDLLKSRDFKKASTDNFGFTSDTIWARFTVEIPDSSHKSWFIEIGYPLLDQIDIYITDDTTVRHRQYGDTMPFDTRDIKHHNFLIRLPKQAGSYNCLLRVQTSSNLNIPIQIISEEGVIEELNVQKTIFGLFYGILIIMILYNLLLSISMRDMVYLWYSLFLISMAMVSLALNGYGFQYLWPETMWLNDLVPHILFLTIITMILFSRHYLSSRRDYPTFDIIVRSYVVLSFSGLITAFFLPYSIMIKIGAAAYLPPIALIVYPMTDSIVKRLPVNRYYTFAFSMLFIGVIITVLNRFGLLPNNLLTLWGFQIGTVFCVALFSLGLAEKVNNLNRNLKELNENLECRVTDRTKKLNEAKEELEAAMSELEATNENLIAANEELHDTHVEHKRDLSLSARVQTSFFPSEVPPSDMYDIAFNFQPSSEISGDFYDFYTTGDLLNGIGLFDISGHGISSGLISLLSRSIIHRIYNSMPSEKLSDITGEVNRHLIEELDAVDHYITGILLRFREEKIDYVNCAHPAMMYRLQSTGKTGMVINRDGMSISGPFLGVQSMEEPFHEFQLKLSSGDTLLLFTDCLAETRDKRDNLYGEIRILESLEAAPDGSAQEILDYVMNEMYSFSGTRENFRDDLTAIVVKKK